MILRSLQVWYKDVRGHLRSTTSLPLPSVNHLCSTKLLLDAELFSRASLFSIFHFRSLLILGLLTYSAEVQESVAKTQNQKLCTNPWQKCAWMTRQDKILRQNPWTEAQIMVICSDALQWLKKKFFSFLRSGSVQHHWTEIYHFVEHLAHKFIR